jgi:hypothetical protein
MRFFIELLVSALIIGGFYYLFNVPHSSSVDMQYVKGFDNGGK